MTATTAYAIVDVLTGAAPVCPAASATPKPGEP